jgi:hypothetical protein
METRGTRPGRLRAVLVALLAIAVMATLLPAAAGAATRSPKKADAIKLATRLVKQQLTNKKRGLVEARISAPAKTKAGAWQFLYDDLAKNGDVCTAKVLVKFKSATSTTLVASFTGSNCQNPGPEALGFRTAARAWGRAALSGEKKLTASLQTYEDTTQQCLKLKVPKANQAQATDLLTIGLVDAVVSPYDTQLDKYAKALQAVGAQDSELVKGAAAWADIVSTARALPKLSPDACSVLKAWAANNYSAETAPVDFAAVDAQFTRLAADIVQVGKTGRRLKRLGLDTGTVADFVGSGLLELLVTGNTGSGSSGTVQGRLAPR